MNLKLVETIDDFKACEHIQKVVWGFSDLELVSASNMIAVSHAGGMTAAAVDKGEVVGFVTAFASYLPHLANPNGVHSHMLAVLPRYRGKGVGKALKWFQRDWCLAQGLSWMTWTFDPLQAKNARLNLEHLGATVSTYRINEYGELGGDLNAGLPTDRLVAFWDLNSKRTQELARGETLGVLDLEQISAALLTDDSRPNHANLGLEDKKISVALPANLNALLKDEPELALEWRLAVREVLTIYLGLGYIITRFEGGSYILEKEI